MLTIDPEPWSPLASIAVRLDEDSAPAVGRARVPLAVIHPEDLAAGILLDIEGELGPVSCDLIPGHTDAEQRSCGPYGFTVHYAPLCEFPAEVEGLERKARPEIANFVLAQKFGTKLDSPDVRDDWNTEAPFGLTQRIDACEADTPSCQTLLGYQEQMGRGLARLDALDRFDDPKIARTLSAVGAGLDWCEAEASPEGPQCKGVHPLRDLFLDDFLVVDTRKRCTLETRSFLEIELAHLQERPPGSDGSRHRTCGGRTPGDDVVDGLLTLTINGPDRVPPGAPFYGPTDADADPPRGDGVDAPPQPFEPSFPWLRAPRHEK